ncbi:MAG: hypothetical protein ABI467_20635 [Kofleriaceae bacterium]
MRAAIASIIVLWAAAAHADSNDLVLSKLGTPITDAMGNTTSVVGDPLAFRALASQLGTVLAPHLLTPADSLGFSGFQMTVDYSTTTIDRAADYWRVLQGTPPSSMQTVGFFARKGLWFPIPSFEVGAGAVHLVDSHLWTGQLYAKVALHEGYHDLPLPSLAVRGAVSRLMTQRELDLTAASLDITISKHVGIAGTWRLDPFAGWDLLMIIPRSEVIDGTPNIDPLTPGNESDSMNNFVFKDQDTIYRNRFFFGTKLQYYVFQLTLEAQFALAGTSIDDRAGTNTTCAPMSLTTNCDAKDTAKAQTTLAMSAGFDF